MADLFADAAVPLQEQIMCVEREIRMRRTTYPRWVAAGKMKLDQAEREQRVMEAVLDTLQANLACGH